MLTWQFLRQNRVALISITPLLLFAFLLRGQPISIHNGRTFLAALLTLLAASWLGVLAFQGDLLQERIRFLAERGVSPTKVWCTRHVPFQPLGKNAAVSGSISITSPDSWV